MQRKKINIMIILLPIVFLSGCNNEKKEKTFKTENYYDAHPKERDMRRKECSNLKEATETIMIDCENAHNSYEKTQSPIYTPTKRH